MLYAQFDHTAPSPAPVIGWYDTEAFSYPSLPASADLLSMTQQQWDARMDGHWAVANGGTLVPYTPPMPELSLRAQAEAALIAGVSIVSTSNPALDGVYPMTPEMRSDIQAEVLSLVVNQSFTNGGTVIGIGDISNTLHDFDAAIFPTFATLYGRHVGALRAVQISNEGTLPSQPVTIP
jgi:hypothetical protein